MQIIICDDEPFYADTICQLIKSWAIRQGHLRSVSIRVFHSTEELIDEWSQGLLIDLLFMDIQIPGEIDGLQAAKQIFSANEYTPIVFVTNYAEYACDGYKVNALRYLRKPIQLEEMEECMNIVWRRWSLQQKTTVMIDSNRQTVHLPVQSVIYAESYLHTVVVHTADKIQRYEIRISLDALKKKLPPELFARCHRSYLVNVMYIRKIQRQEITVSTGTVIPIGRNYAEQFLKTYRQYYRGGNTLWE